MFKFMDYVGRRNRQIVEHLRLIKNMLVQGGIEVVDKTNESVDPYLFVFNPRNDLSFEGVRIYNIGNKLAFRVQKNEDSEPYGRAYGLNVEELFEDMIGDKLDDKEMAIEIAKAVVTEMKMFFKQSAKAENDPEMSKKDPLDRILVRTTGYDFSNTTYNQKF